MSHSAIVVYANVYFVQFVDILHNGTAKTTWEPSCNAVSGQALASKNGVLVDHFAEPCPA